MQMWLVPEVTVAIVRSDLGYLSLFSTLSGLTDSSNLKLQVRALDDDSSVVAAVDAGEVAFAVVRVDQAFPRSGLTAAILRDDPILIFLFRDEKPGPKGANRKREAGNAKESATLRELSGRRIGIVGSLEADRKAVARILEVSGVANVTFSGLEDNPDDVKAAVARKDVEAVVVAASVPRIRLILKALTELKPTLVSVNTTSLAEEMPLLGPVTVAAHSLTNGLPEQEIQTPSVSWRLVAGKDVDRATVSSFLQTLFSNRIALAQSSSLAWPIRGLDDEGSTYAKMPNHRGAMDYYNREQQTIMDLYGDWLWLGLFAAGGASSGLAWVLQMLSRRRKQLVEAILDRLVEILDEVREARDLQKLDKLTLEVDGLVTHAIRQARSRATDPVLTTALTLAIDSTRTAIADTRAMLPRQDRSRFKGSRDNLVTIP